MGSTVGVCPTSPASALCFCPELTFSFASASAGNWRSKGMSPNKQSVDLTGMHILQSAFGGNSFCGATVHWPHCGAQRDVEPSPRCANSIICDPPRPRPRPPPPSSRQPLPTACGRACRAPPAVAVGCRGVPVGLDGAYI